MNWNDVEKRILENEQDEEQRPAPLRQVIFAALQKAGLGPQHATKKMVTFKTSQGETLLWELTSPAQNLFAASKFTDALNDAAFQTELRRFDPTKHPSGGRHSALSRDGAFGQTDCVCVRVSSADDVNMVTATIGSSGTVREEELKRDEIEAAIDAYDAYLDNGENADIFQTFGPPRDYWVRSTRKRRQSIYPTKPIIGYLLRLGPTEIRGGLEHPQRAAARLHNAGYIIVDDADAPHNGQHDGLMKGADRFRLCALNYVIEPARENGAKEVSINVGDFAQMIGSTNEFPNICQTLGGKKFQELAKVAPPFVSGPNPSSTTVFTFKLDKNSKAATMTEATSTPTPSAVNLILYGPPGTGKTYATASEAVRLCLGEQAAGNLTGNANRAALMATYRDLVDQGRIEFVTFHQSMSYEEFVEGLRPTTDQAEDGTASAGFRLEPVAGIFRRMAERAIADEPSLICNSSNAAGGQPSEATLFTIGDTPDFKPGSHREVAQQIALELAKQKPQGFTLDDYRAALVAEGERSGYEPTGGWANHNMPQWASHPNQSWLVPVKNANFQSDAVGSNLQLEQRSSNYVLIIDEINRANISKVFGELITLLEPDKRLGTENEIKLTLPYSKKSFGVPANLHIIGTMNTADRSIALLDTALRRRFDFRELMPDPSVLGTNVGGINLRMLLTTINDRIEFMFDREHQIGHAYFTSCKSEDDIAGVMRDKVIPLLAEYFYEDWSKVAAVLGDSDGGNSRFLVSNVIPAPKGLVDNGTGNRIRWSVKKTFDFSEFKVQ